jgi:hypothetical protein
VELLKKFKPRQTIKVEFEEALVNKLEDQVGSIHENTRG